MIKYANNQLYPCVTNRLTSRGAIGRAVYPSPRYLLVIIGIIGLILIVLIVLEPRPSLGVLFKSPVFKGFWLQKSVNFKNAFFDKIVLVGGSKILKMR